MSVGGSSETFTESGGAFTSVQAQGSTLAFDAGTGLYTYRNSTGAVAVFSAALANGMVFDANVARLTSLTSPSGEQLTFHYKSVTVQSVLVRRLQSVTNNLGYQLHFDYSLNNPTQSSQLAAWRTVTKVTGINNAVDYCDPLADACTGLTQTWPSATYAISGFFETVTDTLGRATRYGGIASGSGLATIRFPSSSSTDHIVIGYDGSGRVSFVSRSLDTWHYAYADASGARTTTVTDPLSGTRVVVSDIATSQVTSDTDEVGRTVAYQYDANNRVTRVTMPDGNYAQMGYDARGNVTQTTQAAKPGSGLSNIVASASFPANCANPLTCNQPTSVTDARGNVTDFTYDATHGGVLTVTAPDPDGAGPAVRPQTRFTYSALSAYYKNSAGAIVAAPTPVQRITAISACATTSSCAGGADETLTTYTYGANGVANNRLPTQSSSGAGNGSLTSTTAVTYDNVGNLLTVDGPLAGTADTTRFRYDLGRQRIGVVGPDPDGAGALKHRAQRITYNADGQPTLIEQGTVNSQSDTDWAAFAMLQQQTVSYDFLGRQTLSTFVASGATHSALQTSYDAVGRPSCQALRMNPAIYGALPSSACTLGMVGANGPDRIARMSYNAAHQPTQLTAALGTPAEGNEWTATYSSNGQLATLSDAAGNLTTYEYDGFDRLRKTRFPNTSGGDSSTTDYEQYSYDAGSNVTQDRRRNGAAINYTYDALNRTTLADAPGTNNDVTFGYDLFGRVTSLVSNGRTLTYSYDQLSRLLSEAQPQGTMSYQYDLASRQTRITWPDALYAVYDYDLTGAVTAIRENGATSGAGVLATYGYDNLGRRVSLSRAGGAGATTSFGYDNASRLASLTHNLAGTADDLTLAFSYDPASGQRSRTATTSNANYRWTPQAPSTTAYADNGLNQYTSVGGAALAYDARGNLTTGGYAYDDFNRLTAAPGLSSLSYDPSGRLYETVGAATTRFLYAGAELAGEYDASGALLRRTVPGPGLDDAVAWYEGSGTSDRRWLLADERGSVVGWANASGASGGAYAYDEYGQPNVWTGARLRFAGAMALPEAQLYHMRARAYAPTLGRFLQTDPISFAGGMNLYAYVHNDPVNFIDPFGLDKLVKPEVKPIIVVGPRNTPHFGSIGAGRSSGGAGSSPVVEYAGPQSDVTDTQGGDQNEIVVTGRRRPRPFNPTSLLRLGLFTTTFVATWAWQDDWSQEEICQDAPLTAGCASASDQPLQPPYMTPIDPDRLRNHEECSQICRDTFIRNRNDLPGVGRNYQQRMGRCVRECMTERGYTPF